MDKVFPTMNPMVLQTFIFISQAQLIGREPQLPRTLGIHPQEPKNSSPKQRSRGLFPSHLGLDATKSTNKGKGGGGKIDVSYVAGESMSTI